MLIEIKSKSTEKLKEKRKHLEFVILVYFLLLSFYAGFLFEVVITIWTIYYILKNRISVSFDNKKFLKMSFQGCKKLHHMATQVSLDIPLMFRLFPVFHYF